jgi:oxygen-independent coproporphyrinogen-3 oxidase
VAPYVLTPEQRAVYRRYASLALPRHTSYPIASLWTSDYGPTRFAADLTTTATTSPDWSLYVHVPFCERLCYYCACTREIVPGSKRQQHDPSDDYLAGLEREMAQMAPRVSGQARQLHLGGGSPTFLGVSHLGRLIDLLERHFRFHPEAERAIEIDPRITTREQLALLRERGFNRISLGVQDFAPEVQQVVNRIQPFEQVAQTVAWCRELGLGSINFDLIYGLPNQTLESMASTLDQTLRLAPDRIAFYRLAVIPEMFRWQNVFQRADLPSGDLPLEMNLLAINRFQEAGYEFIGLDHFARREEALAKASRDGTLRRNFQGMTTGQGLPILAMGPSAISQLPTAFAQNHKETSAWLAALPHGLATERGMPLNDEDRLRADLLQQLYGVGVVAIPALEQRHGIHFTEQFASELTRLTRLAEEGLVEITPQEIRLTAPLGRLLVRVVAAVFDGYLPPDACFEGLDAQAASKVG